MLRKKSVILYLVAILILTGCNKNNNAENFKPKDKAPESLTKLVESLDNILESLGDIEKLAMDIPLSEDSLKQEQKARQQEEGKGQEQQGDGQGQSSQSENKDSKSQEGKEGSEETPKSNGGKQEEKTQQEQISNEEKAIDLWKEMELKLQEAHKSWNSYEAEALEKGATREAGDKFEASFNKFTTSVEGKNIVGVYNYGSESYSNLKPFYDLYMDDIGGEVSILKYATYQSYVRAIQGDTIAASEILNGREENINKIRMKVSEDEDKKSTVEKIALGLTDFKVALTENSRRLFMIKKEVIIDNIKDIQK